MYIPKDLIDVSWQNKEESLAIIVSRISWHDENILRVINESNMDCLFEMCTGSDVKSRYLKLISAVKINNLYENMNILDSPHLILDRVELETRDVLERLIRMN